MDYRKLVLAKAREMTLLGADGKLKKMNSLDLIDFVVSLEKGSNLKIPSDAIDDKNFASVDSVVTLLARLVDTQP